MRASLCLVGPDEVALATSLAKRLFAEGGQHFDCVTLDVDDATWHSRCRLLGNIFQERGLTVEVHAVVSSLMTYVTELVTSHIGRRVVLGLKDYSTYVRVKSALAGVGGGSADIVLAVYETSVGLLTDVRAGEPVVVADLGLYTQGYVALALAFAERHTGQMVTSDVQTGVTIYSRRGQLVTNATMQREVCRAAGNPVCGDPGVLPVTASGCPCFDRTDVRFKVIGSMPKRLLTSHHLYQGLKDVERFLSGSSFPWKIYNDIDDTAQIPEYAEVANGSLYRGAISLDAFTADINPRLAAAMRTVAMSGKPLYLAYVQTPAASIDAFLGKYNARAFVGNDPHTAGRHLGVSALQLGRKHVLGNNNLGYITPTWSLMHGLATSYLGGAFVFPSGTWDFPPWVRWDARQRTGPWALFINPETNETVQVMDGVDPFLGEEALVEPLYTRLWGELGTQPPTDTLIMISFNNFIVPTTLGVLSRLAANQTGRPQISLFSYMCTSMEMSALLRWNLTANEELLLGCVDEQAYLSTYLSATVAALEQQTGERIVGEVRTERLLRYDQLPLNFSRRVACEQTNYERGFAKGQLGLFYPICDARYGCIEPATIPKSLGASPPPCSGHGKCKFPQTPPADGTLAEGSKGSCRCDAGWVGAYCSVYIQVPDDSSPRWVRVLLGVLLSCSVVLALGGIVLWVWSARRRAESAQEHAEAHAMQEVLRKREPPAAGACITAVAIDVDGLQDLLVWDASTTRKALGLFQSVIRAQLPHHYGHEAASDDGAFMLIFHEALDALTFAMELQHHLLHPPRFLDTTSTGALAKFRQRRNSAGDVASDWPSALLKQRQSAEAGCPVTGQTLFRGLRARVGIDVGIMDNLSPRAVGLSHRWKGEVVDQAAAIRNLTSGGQVLLSMPAWRSLGMHTTSIVCHHMGMHMLSPRMAPIHLMQALPEELAKRAPFPPLKSMKQLGPSFFDAPAAECYVKGEPPEDPVVIAFMYVAYAKILRKTPGYQGGVDLLVAFVQSRLAEFEAYEVEEKDGNFLLAFRSATKAVQFGEMVQREAMDLPWSEELLGEDLAAEVLQPVTPPADGSPAEDQVVFRGLRLQIGMCMDVPSDCQPHMATGRAAYFGPVVNRAARIAATAAPGQMLVNDVCYRAAKDHSGRVVFSEMGKFDLKGVKDPMHLFQVSSPMLSARLFPRTLKLARIPRTVSTFKGTLTESDSERDTSMQSIRESSTRLALETSSAPRPMRKSIVVRLVEGLAEGLGLNVASMPAGAESPLGSPSGNAAEPSRHRHLMSLSGLLAREGGNWEGKSPKSRLAPIATASPTASMNGQQGKERRRSSEERRQQSSEGRHSSEEGKRRTSDGAGSLGRTTSLEDIKYDELSYNELVKLAVKQHRAILELKKRPAMHPVE
eukprot:jgi/Mesvir1/22916/Mv19435-RA.2